MVWLWGGFVALVLALLALDLGVFHRQAHVVSFREALGWSAVWITMGLAFAVFVGFAYDGRWFGLGIVPDPVDGAPLDGPTAALKYLTGYVVEKSLSVDNIFVIAMIFSFFGVPAIYQHRVLYWGILGALLMRGAMIAVGARLIAEFHWILYIFGVFLILTGVKMLIVKPQGEDLSRNPVVRLARRLLPVTDRFHGGHFVVRVGSAATLEAARAGAWMLTPLALALILVETTDLIFAVDSIPAIFAITGDTFLVFTSNVFAILGLRSLYFALAELLASLRYLKVALAVVLMVVGSKMLAAGWLKDILGGHFHFYLLAVILLILAIGAGASLLFPPRSKAPMPQGA